MRSRAGMVCGRPTRLYIALNNREPCCILCGGAWLAWREALVADESEGKKVKVGVRAGGGPPPGYSWTVRILDAAWREARDLLNDDQYEHIAGQFRELARQDDPTRSQMVDVRPIEDFYELRDKGGILGKLNARVFFFVHKPARSIVVLTAFGKQNDGPTPSGDKIRGRVRKRRYLQSLGESP